MPPVEWGDYILEYLFEIGPTMADGPLTFSEIESWMRTTEIHLSPFEVRLIRRLSREYLGESFAATKRDREPPYVGNAAERDANRKAVQRAMDQAIDRFLA